MPITSNDVIPMLVLLFIMYPVYFNLAWSSLRFHVLKLSPSNDELSNFLNAVRFPYSVWLLSTGAWLGGSVITILDELDSIKKLGDGNLTVRRLIFAFAAGMYPVATTIRLFQPGRFSLLLVLLALVSGCVFFIAWTFGNDLHEFVEQDL